MWKTSNSRVEMGVSEPELKGLNNKSSISPVRARATRECRTIASSGICKCSGRIPAPSKALSSLLNITREAFPAKGNVLIICQV